MPKQIILYEIGRECNLPGNWQYHTFFVFCQKKTNSGIHSSPGAIIEGPSKSRSKHNVNTCT